MVGMPLQSTFFATQTADLLLSPTILTPTDFTIYYVDYSPCKRGCEAAIKMIPLPTHALTTRLAAQVHTPAIYRAQWYGNIDMYDPAEITAASLSNGTRTTFIVLVHCDFDIRYINLSKARQAIVCLKHH